METGNSPHGTLSCRTNSPHGKCEENMWKMWRNNVVFCRILCYFVAESFYCDLRCYVVIMGRVLASAARTPSRDSIIQTTRCKNLPCTICHAVATISYLTATHCGLSWRFPLTDNTWPYLIFVTGTMGGARGENLVMWRNLST